MFSIHLDAVLRSENSFMNEDINNHNENQEINECLQHMYCLPLISNHDGFIQFRHIQHGCWWPIFQALIPLERIFP